MNRILHPGILVLAVLILLVGCSSGQVAVKVKPGETFTIGVGQSAQITGEEMTVTFNQVISDSRCPQNVTCIWEGVASSNITIAYKGVNSSIVLNQPGSAVQAQNTFNNFTLVHNLNPYPRADEEFSTRDYRLTLTVTR